MTHRQFLETFERAAFEPGTFHHREHVRAVWCLLRHYPLIEALGRVRAGLHRIVSRFGAEEKYHETITVALVLIIHERMAQVGEPQSWEEFTAGNPDLLEWRDGALLEPYYSPATLDSELARIAFVSPDRYAENSAGVRR